MSRTVILDADVIGHLNRGNEKAAEALKKLIESGATVYIARYAYDQLTSQPGKMIDGIGPDLPRTAAGNKQLIEDLKIKVAPASRAVATAHGSKGPLSTSDANIAREASALNAEVWSFDKGFRNDPNAITKQFGVKVAPESQSAYKEPVKGKREDYRVARQLMRLKEIEITVAGRIIKPPIKKKPSGSGGGGTGTPGHTETKTVVGVPNKPPSLDVDPSVSRGQRIGNAVELGLRGYNFLIQKLNDAKQGEKVKEEWERIKPGIEAQLASDPTLGALIIVRFGRRKKQGGEHESPLEHLNVFLSIETEYGPTQSEAWDTWAAKARLSSEAHLEISSQLTFIPPINPVDMRKLRTPFTAYALGTFVSGKASLIRVAWKGVFGFDEAGDVKLGGDAETARFLLLIAPNEITWFNGTDRNSADVPLDWKAAGSVAPHASNQISVVDLDRGFFNVGDDTAAMIFPADAPTARLFESVGPTRDSTGQIRTYVNFDKVRWVRPQNVYVLQTFMLDRLDQSSRSDNQIQVAPKEPARTR